MSENRFTWGDSVRVAETEGVRIDWRPGAIGSVCGVRRVETEQQAKLSSFPIGTVIYTVEFNDGESTQVPEEALERVE